MWTSPNSLPFLAITCHYININWDLKTVLLDFNVIFGTHSGKNLADSFIKSTTNMNILDKVNRINLNN